MKIDKYFHMYGRKDDVVLEEIEKPELKKKGEWIPCSERLPERSERYLVTAFDGTYRRTTVVLYQPRTGTWALTGRMAYWEVLAWMPLPEPYREAET